MRPREPRALVRPWALALGAVALGGCVMNARLGTLDGDELDASAETDAGDDSETGPSSMDGPGVLPPGLEPYEGEAVILDCDLDAGYEVSAWRASEPTTPQLWVGGVYETRGDHSAGNHPVGEGTVTWAIPGRNVLVLGAYEPTDWTIVVAPGGELDQVIATGYHPQTVQAPEGVEVQTHALLEGATRWACGYSLPGHGGGCEGEELVWFAESITGLALHAFDGCYHASAFEYAP